MKRNGLALFSLAALMMGELACSGEKGDTGNPGEQGYPGEKGDQGDSGEKGDPGEDADLTCKGNAAPIINQIVYTVNMCQGSSQVLTIRAEDPDAQGDTDSSTDTDTEGPTSQLTYEVLGTCGIEISPAYDPMTEAELDNARTLSGNMEGGPFYLNVEVSDGCDTAREQVKIYIESCHVVGHDVLGGGPGSDAAYAVVTTGEGGAFVAGRTFDNLGGLDCDEGFTCGGLTDIFIQGYESPYFPSTVKVLGGPGNEMPIDLVNDPATDDLYLIGYTDGDLDDQQALDHQSHSFDIFVIKFNSAGVKQWTKIFGTEDFDEPGEGAFYDGHLYVPAYVKGAYGSNTAVGRRDNLLLKIDGETGEEVWAKQWGTGNGDEATSVAIDSAGAIYVAGHWADYDDIRTATLTKFDAEGNQVFEMEDVEIYSLTKVIVDDDDNVFMLLNASSPVIRKIDASNGDVLDETVVKVNGGSWLSLASIVRSKGNDLYTCGERDSDVVIARLDASDLSAQAETWTFGTTNFDSCLDMHGYYLEQSDKWFVRSTGEWGYIVMDDEHGGGTFLSDFFMNTIIFP